ncbi:MAG: hypothetical protein HY855_26865 [Burkholderiales bacterium]|nr:hypothetical protein [Burkholderiales bacterium]
MSRQYSSKDFFRQMPNALLARYFHSRGLLPELDFGAMPEGKPEALFESWAALTDVQRSAAEADFRDIVAMCDRKGWLAIVDEARWQLEDQPEALQAFIDTLAALDDHHARAMVAFLDHPECWKGATRFHHADGLTHWRKRKNLPRVQAAVDKASVARLAELIKHYFRQADGRGRNCVVEAYRRGTRDYFFAFPEDHAERSIEWVDGEFNPRPHNPAFEIVFVYSQTDGTLDLNFRGGRSAITALQGMFAQAILKLDELPPDPKDERVYDLAPLTKPGFQFTHPVGCGVGTVVVKKLRLSSRVRAGDKITVEADGHSNREAVHELLAQVGQSVPLHLYNVTQVELAATVFVAEGKPPKTVNIRITHPNSCSLKYDEIDLSLRQMLEASGIEPLTPAPAANSDAGAPLAPAVAAG